MKNKIYIGSDHAGFEAKEKIKKILTKLGYEYLDRGTYNKESVDYPDIARNLLKCITKNPEERKGILICGSGAGMQIVANKFPKIRAVFAYDEYSAEMARKDNNANVLTLRGRNFDDKKYEGIVKKFLETDFSNEERHIRRIKKISKIEINNCKKLIKKNEKGN